MNKWSCLSAPILCLFAAHAWASDVRRMDILFDMSGSLRQSQPALVSIVQTLSWSFVLAAEQDQIDDVTLALTGFCEDAEQMRVAGRDVFDTTQWPAAAAEMKRPGRVCMGEEDGWNALEAALQARPESQPGHLLLISDEPRSVVHEKIDQKALLAALYERQLVLDAMVAVALQCGDGRSALGLTSQGIGYVMTESGAYDMCTNAQIDAATGSTVSDYVTLALASGGSVWNVNSLREFGRDQNRIRTLIETIAQSYTSAVLNRVRWTNENERSRSRPLISKTRVTAGEAVSLDGRLSRASRPDLAVTEWLWDIGGDGSPEYYGPDGSHAFHVTGYHPITLTVIDSAGKKDRTTLWIDVYEPGAP